MAPHGSSACQPQHGLFVHASKRALARHVLPFCSLSHLGHGVGMESGSHGTHGKGQRCRVLLLAGMQWGQHGRGTAEDMGVQLATSHLPLLLPCPAPARPPSVHGRPALQPPRSSSPPRRCLSQAASPEPRGSSRLHATERVWATERAWEGPLLKVSCARQGPAELGSWPVGAHH